MKTFHPRTTAEQLAEHLREEFLLGRLGGSIPGVNRLAGTLGVSPKTVIAAVKQLEREGMLQGQGPRRRRIAVPAGGVAGRRLRVAILDYCASPDPTFVWCQPTVAHIHYDLRPVLRRVVRWTANMARGKDDSRQSLTKAEFVDGGTIGPVRRG